MNDPFEDELRTRYDQLLSAFDTYVDTYRRASSIDPGSTVAFNYATNESAALDRRMQEISLLVDGAREARDCELLHGQGGLVRVLAPESRTPSPLDQSSGNSGAPFPVETDEGGDQNSILGLQQPSELQECSTPRAKRRKISPDERRRRTRDSVRKHRLRASKTLEELRDMEGTGDRVFTVAEEEAFRSNCARTECPNIFELFDIDP
jgi:hypothetical protein